VVELILPPDSHANSYASPADADEYLGTYVFDDAKIAAWNAMSADQRAKLLIMATKRIDEYFIFRGRRTFWNQQLEWPRYLVYVAEYPLDPTLLPPRLVQATVDTALWLMDNSEAQSVQNASTQYSALEVGALKVKFKGDNMTPAKQYLSDNTIATLELFGTYNVPYNGSGMRVATLYR
jgi:hypothetical protein